MNTIIENLDRYYDSFIDQENNWTFFVGLADYVKYIIETPKIKAVFDRPKEDKNKEIVVLNMAEEEAVKELLEIKEKIIDYIKKKRIGNKKYTKDALIRLSEYESAKIEPTHYKSSRLQGGLQDLLKVIAENGQKEWVKENLPVKIEEIYVFGKDNKSIPRFSCKLEPDKLLARYSISISIGNREDTELWGVREHLVDY